MVFDIGGVLELTPRLGVTERWETALGLPAGHIDTHMASSWAAGALGVITEEDVQRELTALLGTDADAFMADVWTEYLGTLNTGLTAYLRDLRPRYRTGILSNSFVGAREREQAAYGFADLVDHLVYSHEAGLAKPDPRAYLLVCERLGVAPEEAVFLDDVAAYVTGARRVGMRAVLYRDNAQAVAALDALLGR
ncbi:HAD family hydrolase [Nonomuraea sp. NPDC050783]|uniref:HAD family hydrolase n=1 Tax=Nonomuraea sp. NPDC050783 TaxID=3154634 RepID=UPI0034674EE7